MRTLHFVPADKQARIAEETLDIYAPLAGRMGMQNMRDELEELAFRHLMPEASAMIKAKLDELREKYGKVIAKVEQELRDELSARGIEARVEGRQKQPYSVWRKMERKSIAFEQLSDIFGFRVVVKSVEDCYRAIGVVHTKWPTVPGRFKDYISTPKENDYRSIHTTVVGPGGQRVELQVRTAGDAGDCPATASPRMCSTRTGASPIAKVWRARAAPINGCSARSSFSARADSPEEFLEHTKLELFRDQVFCFTPKGELIALPRGATPIDFAYAVHTDVGNSAVGAKINGGVAPLVSELQNGDEVEIVRAVGQMPPAAWESLVVTGKARAAIRRATRDAVRAQYTGLGRQIVLRAFERAGKAFGDDKLKAALPRLARAGGRRCAGRRRPRRNFLRRCGQGRLSRCRRTSARRTPPRPEGESGWFPLAKAASLVFKVPGGNAEAAPNSIPIRGLRGDLPVRFTPNGGAVPGDRIVGILTPGEGITIYPIQSPDLTAFDDQPERWLDVRWDIEEGQHELFPAKIVVTAINEPGTLGMIATLIGDTGANIDNISIHELSADFREMIIDVEVTDLKHLNGIISQLRGKPVVSKVERVNG